ncbi:DUF1127 domain-containing protein [Cucumibacter marinus]|jgi:uncharacterized protein YjiS (DUF1127 family)|nr:DUF1127 domain-containing protein [Cucumibacter marinus]
MSIRDSFRRWNTFRRTVRELESLDDRQLNDLGISRGDIRYVARDHAERI